MNTNINALCIDLYNPGESETCQLNLEMPSKCPHCETAYALQPEVSVYYESDNSTPQAYSIFFCPNCEECFFVSYLIPGYMEDSVGVIQEIFPIAKHTSTFSEEILSLSPDFVKIFNQAEQAENQNLHDICGIGYRKSLEFLVKDYCIKIHPDKQSTIESLPLAKCISDYIDNEKISTLAKVSAWIGNDETHYTRKHQNYNIQDLKKFIKAMVAYIEYELTFTEAFELLSNPR